MIDSPKGLAKRLIYPVSRRLPAPLSQKSRQMAVKALERVLPKYIDEMFSTLEIEVAAPIVLLLKLEERKNVHEVLTADLVRYLAGASWFALICRRMWERIMGTTVCDCCLVRTVGGDVCQYCRDSSYAFFTPSEVIRGFLLRHHLVFRRELKSMVEGWLSSGGE